MGRPVVPDVNMMENKSSAVAFISISTSSLEFKSSIQIISTFKFNLLAISFVVTIHSASEISNMCLIRLTGYMRSIGMNAAPSLFKAKTNSGK